MLGVSHYHSTLKVYRPFDLKSQNIDFSNVSYVGIVRPKKYLALRRIATQLLWFYVLGNEPTTLGRPFLLDQPMMTQ